MNVCRAEGLREGFSKVETRFISFLWNVQWNGRLPHSPQLVGSCSSPPTNNNKGAISSPVAQPQAGLQKPEQAVSYLSFTIPGRGQGISCWELILHEFTELVTQMLSQTCMYHCTGLYTNVNTWSSNGAKDGLGVWIPIDSTQSRKIRTRLCVERG